MTSVVWYGTLAHGEHFKECMPFKRRPMGSSGGILKGEKRIPLPLGPNPKSWSGSGVTELGSSRSQSVHTVPPPVSQSVGEKVGSGSEACRLGRAGECLVGDWVCRLGTRMEQNWTQENRFRFSAAVSKMGIRQKTEQKKTEKKTETKNKKSERFSCFVCGAWCAPIGAVRTGET